MTQTFKHQVNWRNLAYTLLRKGSVLSEKQYSNEYTNVEIHTVEYKSSTWEVVCVDGDWHIERM